MDDQLAFYVLIAIIAILGFVFMGIDNHIETDQNRFDQCISAGMEYIDGDCVNP